MTPQELVEQIMAAARSGIARGMPAGYRMIQFNSDGKASIAFDADYKTGAEITMTFRIKFNIPEESAQVAKMFPDEPDAPTIVG